MRDAWDVAVLGGGMAGVAAALAAAQHGARVLLVRAAPGATALTLGGWLGMPPEAVRAALARAGLALEIGPYALPRPDGTLIEADAAPLSHARASLHDAAEPVLVLGIAGLADFFPRALAALWTDAARQPIEVRSDTITITATPAAGWSPVSLAALLEREPQRIGEQVRAAAAKHGVRRVILPAILGLEAHVTVHAAVERHTGLVVGETLAGTPSLPGWRLDHALRAALAAAGVHVISARVGGRSVSGRMVTGIALHDDAGARTVRAASFVLATGKFLGGGIGADPHFVESALGCTVRADWLGHTFEDASHSLLLSAELRVEPQPLLAVGVAVDAEARPMNGAGDVAYDNVFIAGAVRADVTAPGLGLGHAAVAGWSAGTRAAARAHTAA